MIENIKSPHENIPNATAQKWVRAGYTHFVYYEAYDKWLGWVAFYRGTHKDESDFLKTGFQESPVTRRFSTGYIKDNTNEQ